MEKGGGTSISGAKKTHDAGLGSGRTFSPYFKKSSYLRDNWEAKGYYAYRMGQAAPATEGIKGQERSVRGWIIYP